LTRRILNPTFLLVSLDFTLAVVAFCLAYLLRFQMDLDASAKYIGPLAPRALHFAAAIMTGLLAMGLYRARQRPRTWEMVVRVMIGVGIGALLCILLFYLFPYLSSGRGVLASALLLAFTTLCSGRLLILPFIDRNPVKRRIIVIGVGSAALNIGRLRRASDRRRFEIVGFAALMGADMSIVENNPQIQPVIHADEIAQLKNIDEVVIALDERRGALPTDLLLEMKGRGIPVTDIVNFLERETGKMNLNLLSPSWFIYTDAGYTLPLYRSVKRIVDVFMSAVIFVLTAPIFAAVIIAICCENGIRVPIFYRQTRVGRAGCTFELLKFRSMDADAEATTGPQWSVKNDARVTHVGRLIRRFRIDELPQLFNVFRGEMSIVGPRPERPTFCNLVTAEEPMFGIRHAMRPGLTGWAQLNFPYGASVIDAREKLSYDLYYIKNASSLLDLLILLQTIEVVVWGKAISMSGPRPLSDQGAGSKDAAQGSITLPEFTDAPLRRVTPAVPLKD
jgi:sugar transferase (PEP-CTERM system associated)